MSHPDDAFDDLLGRPAAACDDELRRGVLAQTLRVLRRRRQQRRIAVTGVLAAGLLLAITGVFIFHNLERAKRLAPVPGPVVVETPVPEPPAADTPAVVLERLGETSPPTERSTLYRRAGDRYLVEAADPRDVLRCYTQALDEGSENDLTISSDDTWLLMALKMDRKKEKTHAKRD